MFHYRSFFKRLTLALIATLIVSLYAIQSSQTLKITLQTSSPIVYPLDPEGIYNNKLGLANTYTITYPGPAINMFATLKAEIKGVKIYCSADPLGSGSGTYKKNVRLSKTPALIAEKISNSNEQISVRYTVKIPKGYNLNINTVGVYITLSLA